jgi:hypothetical protein
MVLIFKGFLSFTLGKPLLYMVLIYLELLSFQVVATEAITINKNNLSKKVPLVINSQVKGSQEQPNIIYIMPWQGIENPIRIEGNMDKISLPHFKPINPKLFRKQARLFYKESSSKQEQVSSSKEN